jgi:hypothetical protein
VWADSYGKIRRGVVGRSGAIRRAPVVGVANLDPPVGAGLFFRQSSADLAQTEIGQ